MAEITEAEGKKLIEAFNKLKIKPKADTPEDLETWLKAYAGVKVEPVDGLNISFRLLSDPIITYM